MKQFLYLDTDIVNSIIAQSDKGLVQVFSNETETQETESNTVYSSVAADAKIGGSLMKLVKAEANLASKLDGTTNGGNSHTSREIISKTLHDAAFDIATAQIQPYNAPYSDQSHDETGAYIQLTRVFDFVDFDYLEGWFAPNGIIEFIKKSSAEQIEVEAEKVKETTNREQLRKAGINFKAEVKKAIATSNKQFDDIASIIKVMRSLIPYNRMLISADGYLIPLSEKYFRVDPSDIGFKYGGEITCVGMITNIIGEDCDPNDESNVFATLQHTSNKVMISLLPTKEKNLCVLHPIAIYYGE